MPKWGGEVVETLDDTKEFWKNQNRNDMSVMMGTGWRKRIKWLQIATGIISSSGTVFEPGCGEGIMVEALPEMYDLKYVGVDLNTEFVRFANERYGIGGPKYRPYSSFNVEDVYEFLGGQQMFDWVIVSNFFGLFPEEETYKLIPMLWSRCAYGMSITTLNKTKYHNPRARRRQLTSHDPEELHKALSTLPGAGHLSFESEMQDGNMNRKMAAYLYRSTYEGPFNVVPEGVDK